ncbi:MAG: carbon-nitrogen hydrolase family protein [Spirochaetales bacterium]|nr:carbon-nitrogen hydrolase family protein [Spirochaetales bacterium]MDY5915381.1 carbon-nitrogen hydrolase family protein [Treponema sp.]
MFEIRKPNQKSDKKVERVKKNMISKLKIALLQIAPCKTLEENLEKGIVCCRKAKERGADIALFPEMWSNGYNIYGRHFDEWKAEAISADSDFINTFGEIAKELDMAVGITLLEKYENAPRNSLVLFDRFGKKKFVYAKVHTCDFDVERNLTPGDDFYVTTLDTAIGDVKVGAMICYDREFPESARILMLKGAELILVPNACPMEINRLSQLRGRAYENMTAIATCNYPETVPDCNGGSSVFDGVAYLPELPESRDTCILQADGKEGIYLAELNLEQLRNYRKREVHGNAYRHPKKYGLLTDTKISEPFVRNGYRE